ncbi:MAG: class I SAM-dependent methyltransferase [Chloroflexota bacterium]
MQQHIDEAIWKHYQADKRKTIQAITPRTALDAFYLCILAYSNENLAEAYAYIQQAVHKDSTSLLYQEATKYLSCVLQHGTHQAYTSPAGFEAFIRGGSNVVLYENLRTALRHIYTAYTDLRLLDIGVGDGEALLPALPDAVGHLDVVEPSTAMLTKLEQELQVRNITYQAYNQTLQDFAKDQHQHWPLIQATFSLQSLSYEERPHWLIWLHAHTDRLLIAEFDVPVFSDSFAPDRVEYVARTFETGLAEYQESDLVAQEFMLPIMFSYFDRSAGRMNYEQPTQQWVDDLKAAGFTTITTNHLHQYWWADAYLIDASR